MTSEMAKYDFLTGGIASQASAEAVASQMPGRENGPADAYRHLLLSAELTRRYGETYAKVLLDLHERTGNHDGQLPDAEAMDRHNNEVGISIGNELKKNPNSTWDDVVKKVQTQFDPQNKNGSGAQWLPESRWGTNPIGDDGKRIPNGDPRLNWPPQWLDKPFNSSGKSGYIPIGDANHNGIPDILESSKIKFTTAETTLSPIILDLDGDGVETTAVGSGAYFDHDANGFAESTGWVGADDGLLVRDLDSNGTIDSGRELFGNNTLLANGSKAANGFAALAELDSNKDGIINSSDSAFASLKIWKDSDGDGYTSAGELLTLAQAGVQSINLSTTSATTPAASLGANGNSHQQIGSYTTTYSYFLNFISRIAILIVSLFYISISPSVVAGTLITNEQSTTKQDASSKKYGYNYDAVCSFITSMLDKVKVPTSIIKKESEHIVSKKQAKETFIYRKSGITTYFQYEDNQSELVNTKSIFLANTLPNQMQTKAYFASAFDIDLKKIGSDLSLGCDALSIVFNFSDTKLNKFEISPEFID